MLYPSFLKLRASDPNIIRPYKFPGGKYFIWIISFIGIAFIIQAIIFFLWVPGSPIDWAYDVPILGGVFITLLVGEILLKSCGGNKQ